MLKQAEMQDGFHSFYPVLRLIPDLCFKAEKCMELVQHCLYKDSQRGYQKEREFLLNVWLPKRNRLKRGESVPSEELTNTIVDAQVMEQSQ